jgi:hypothetical protein
MDFSTLKKRSKKEDISSAEAYYLWDITKSKYTSLEKLTVWSNFIHDQELLRYIELYISDIKKFINNLEESLERYGIKGPDSHTFSVRTKINTDIIRDQLITQDMYMTMQEHLEMLLSAITSATTNDEVRTLFIERLKLDLDRIGLVTKYIKTKGWLG